MYKLQQWIIMALSPFIAVMVIVNCIKLCNFHRFLGTVNCSFQTAGQSVYLYLFINQSCNYRMFNRGAVFCKCYYYQDNLCKIECMCIIELLTSFIMSEFCCDNGKLSSALYLSQLLTLFYCRFEFNIILPIILLFTLLILYRVPVAPVCSKCTNKSLCCRNLITR